MNPRFTHFALFGLTALSAIAAPKHEEMDYGPFLSATFVDVSTRDDKGKEVEGKSTLNGATRLACNKGVGIKLTAPGGGGMIFDTDLLRMTGGWIGGSLKLKGVAFEGGHGANPSVAEEASIVFGTRPSSPGWSSTPEFNDPRKLPSGPGAAKVPFGPLPREQARYRGLHRHGENVVLAYTVGAASVLELPAAERAGDATVLTRTLNFTATPQAPAASGGEVFALLAQAPDGVQGSVQREIAMLDDDPKQPGSRLFIGVIGLPPGAALVTDGKQVMLKLPSRAAASLKIAYWRGPESGAATFAEALKGLKPAADLTAFTKGGAPLWPETVTTKGKLAADEPGAAFVVDSIEPPTTNPWKSWIRFGGLDFFKDGRAALCTWSGDVWIASGIDAQLANVSWRRFAAGLHQALGLKIVDEKIYVLGRDQITRLHDVNNDGESDHYENFNNDVQVTPGFHEFALDLHTDPQGNFYFAKGGPVNPGGSGWGPLSDHNGTLLRVSKDGQKLDIFATGIRAPNGLGVGPEGQVTVGDNEGTWVPACYLHLAKKDEFISVTDLAHRAEKPTDYGRHILFFPKDVDNSNGAQVWVTSDQWAPMKGRLLHLSYGQASLLSVLTETVDGQIQGGAVQFPLKLETGTMRARFHPTDGQLYIAGLKGWQTKGTKDGAFYRVRCTGKPIHQQSSLRVTDKGIHIGFFNPVDAKSAADAENYSIQQYNYRWSQNYGSADYKLSDPAQKGRDDVEIKSVKLAPDKKSVFLEVPDLQPVMQMRIKMNITAADGTPLPGEIVNTINAVGKE